MKRLHVWLAVALIIGGCLYLGVPKAQAAWERHEGQRQLPATVAGTREVMNLGTPVVIELPRLKVRLDIQAGAYNTARHTWRLDSTHAFYAAKGSVNGTLPATPLIYGHSLPTIFQPLEGATDGERLTITTADNRTLLFGYAGDRTVAPSDDSVLRTHLDNTLLVMTCSGTLSESRRALYFVYEGVR